MRPDAISASSRIVSYDFFRHSLATHLLAEEYDARTIQDLLGHKDVRTIMVHTHVLNGAGGRGVRSPADTLFEPDLGGSLEVRQLPPQSNLLPPGTSEELQLVASEEDTDDFSEGDEEG
jgi:hypothetical protein